MRARGCSRCIARVRLARSRRATTTAAEPGTTRHPGDPRLLGLPKKLHRAVRGGERLRPGGAADAATPASSPTSWCSPRTTRSATRSSASTTPSPPAPSTRACFADTPPTLPGRRGRPTRSPTAATELTPVDYGDVCVNVDHAWFADHDRSAAADPRRPGRPGVPGPLRRPRRADHARPASRSCWPRSRQYGEDGWQDYWTRADGQRRQLASGWTDAYTVDFTGGGGKGDRPIVAVLRLVAAVHRSPRDRGGRPPRRCWTPASARSSTPGCWPAPKNPEGAAAARRLPAQPTSSRRRCRTTCTSSRSTTGVALPAAGRSSPASPTTPFAVDPADDRREPRRLAAGVERRDQPLSRAMSRG